ncbi:MAG: glycyl-radical enzyme activating protein [Candidatus Bathyarchaeia archaeon]
MKGLVIKIQRYSIQDGPGIRSTIFLKGCPLNCLWCSNPESQIPFQEIMFNKFKCIKDCKNCVKTCPINAIIKSEDKIPTIRIDRKACIKCGDCVKACPSEALTLIGNFMEANQVIEEIKKDFIFYEKSNGGITISGGEPLFQPFFTMEILKLCKKEKIHTAIDTSGYGNWEKIKKILRYTDLVLYDIKHMDPILHEKYTGVKNEIILENALKISKEKNVSLIIRIPIIPTLNDSESNINKLINFIKKFKRLDGIDILPYHKLGIAKYEMLEREYQLKDIQPPNEIGLSRIKSFLEDYGFKVRIIL